MIYLELQKFCATFICIDLKKNQRLNRDEQREGFRNPQS